MPLNVVPIDRSRGLHDRVVAAYEDAREDVYRYVLTLGLSPAQAQEVAQEVFLRLYVSLQRGDEIENIRGWVFRVAHNYGLKVRAKERGHTPIEPGIDLPASGTPSPEQRVIERQGRQRVQEALAELSPQQRECLQLRISGLRYREIGETLGLGTSTVNEFLRRAITKLKKALE